MTNDGLLIYYSPSRRFKNMISSSSIRSQDVVYSVSGFLSEESASVGRGHLLRHPKSNTPPNETKPYHEVVFFRAVKTGHCVSKDARVDEEGREASDRVML